MTNPEFSKGQQVFVIAQWSREGTTFIRECTVHSCGKKQMVLHDDKGQKFAGNNFQPTSQQSYLFCVVLPVSIGRDAAEARAQQMAEDVISYEIELCEGCLSRQPDASPAYVAAILKDRNAAIQYQPSVIWR